MAAYGRRFQIALKCRSAHAVNNQICGLEVPERQIDEGLRGGRISIIFDCEGQGRSATGCRETETRYSNRVRPHHARTVELPARSRRKQEPRRVGAAEGDY